MSSSPFVSIDLGKIEHNARAVTSLCRKHGIEIVGVTKGTCGLPCVAQAMLRGGVAAIGESRLENIKRLRSAGIDASYMLLRTPPLSAVDEVVRTADISLNSEASVIVALSEAAGRLGKVHDIIIMVDLGDLREGVWPDELISFIGSIVNLPGIRILGLGTNLSCYGGVIPTPDNMQALIDYASRIEHEFGLNLRYISVSVRESAF